MKAAVLALHGAGVSLQALLTGDDGPERSAVALRSNLLAFDVTRRRGPAQLPDMDTYNQALPAVDRLADEHGAAERYRALGAWYASQKQRGLSQDAVHDIWRLHVEYFFRRQKAAFQAGFAAGQGTLGAVRERLVNLEEAPTSTEPAKPETDDDRVARCRREHEERAAREWREQVEWIRAHRKPTRETLVREVLRFVAPRLRDRIDAAGLKTLGDLETWTEQEVAAIPYLQQPPRNELKQYMEAAGLTFREGWNGNVAEVRRAVKARIEGGKR